MDHGKSRGPSRSRFDHAPVELGNEPPLSVDGQTNGAIDRRRVSVQWFSGTILTGLCGAALMGGAVFASLDGETTFASVPERLEIATRNAFGGDKLASHKADRLPPAGESTGLRQMLRDTRVTRVGDHEVPRVRTFIRVSSNLALSTSELTAKLPPFNAAKMLTDSSGAPAPDESAAAPDAEVAFVMRDLGPLLTKVKIAATPPADDILTRVRDATNWSTSKAPPQYAVAGSLPTGQLAYAVEGNTSSDPYAGFEARIVPENITLLPKTASQVTGGNAWAERAITTKKGDSLGSILRDIGALPDEIKAIAAIFGPLGRDGAMKEGQKLRILCAATPSGRQQPIRVIVSGDNRPEAAVALSDLGKYVAIDVKSIDTDVADANDEEEDDGRGVRLYQSIYETALRSQIPRPVIDDLIRVYSYDVDFQRKAQAGDSFDVLYAGDEDSSSNDVVYASLTVGGETKKFYRYQSPDDGVVDYYDENGKSAKKFLVRKPVADGIMRSGFGARRHPILGFMKMHTGVDWAAPLGTPIFAAGNGTIEKAGWESGYGKYVRIRHNNGYETAYGHMTAFARSTQPGARVRQGQVIGYVGSTGMATGAHVHFEILVNDRFVDPMRIKLPRGRVLDGSTLAGFERERDRLDTLMARGGARLAQGNNPPTAR